MSPDDGRCREAPTAVCSVLRSGHKFITQVEVHVQQIAVHILRSGTFAWRRALVRVCAATPAAAPPRRARRWGRRARGGAGGARAPRPRAAPRAARAGARRVEKRNNNEQKWDQNCTNHSPRTSATTSTQTAVYLFLCTSTYHTSSQSASSSFQLTQRP